MTDPEEIPIPEITEAHLQKYAALILSDGAWVFQEASQNAESGDEIIQILTDTIIRAFNEAVLEAARATEDVSLDEEAHITEQMTLKVRTIAAACICLLPLYEATAKQIELRRQISIFN